MPLPIYGSQSSGLTQSNDDARQQGNRAIGYDPTALERVLDWIGRQFGSDSAAKDPGPSGGSRVLEWIGRQLGGDPYAPGGAKNPKVTDPYDRSNPAVDAWFRSLYNSPTPFGQVPYGPPAPQLTAKAVTKISSADKLHKKISDMIGPPPDDPPQPDFGQNSPFDYSQYDMNLGPLPAQDGPSPPIEQMPMDYSPYEMNLGPFPPQDRPRQVVDMTTPPMPPEYNLGPLPARNPTQQEISAYNRDPRPLRQIPGKSPFIGAGYGNRAQGGPIGYMRGGYPEVYGAQRLPVRHTFDSGGANFVDRGYSQQSGRADDVNAKLSPMEYVMDSESMALLGDGNPEHGAKKMDEMRANLRRHKGKVLAKGKFSPKAKSAHEYLAGNPMGDGLRRRGRDKG